MLYQLMCLQIDPAQTSSSIVWLQYALLISLVHTLLGFYKAWRKEGCMVYFCIGDLAATRNPAKGSCMLLSQQPLQENFTAFAFCWWEYIFRWILIQKFKNIGCYGDQQWSRRIKSFLGMLSWEKENKQKTNLNMNVALNRALLFQSQSICVNWRFICLLILNCGS